MGNTKLSELIKIVSREETRNAGRERDYHSKDKGDYVRGEKSRTVQDSYRSRAYTISHRGKYKGKSNI